jgi:hypothetical protein
MVQGDPNYPLILLRPSRQSPRCAAVVAIQTLETQTLPNLAADFVTDAQTNCPFLSGRQVLPTSPARSLLIESGIERRCKQGQIQVTCLGLDQDSGRQPDRVQVTAGRASAGRHAVA